MVAVIQDAEVIPMPIAKHIASLESQLSILVEKQAITELLNDYAIQLDACGTNKANWSEGWERNFHPEAYISYPFGERHGGVGVGKWASATMNQFVNYHHLSGNFQISLDKPDANGVYQTAFIKQRRQDRTYKHTICLTTMIYGNISPREDTICGSSRS